VRFSGRVCFTDGSSFQVQGPKLENGDAGRGIIERRFESEEKQRMASTVKTEHPHIVRLEGVCGGEPVIDGLRVTVRHVATLHRQGEAFSEIAEGLGLSEAQVFHALSYFFDHQDEINALIMEEEQAHGRFAEE
jgi:uncharacterized protein (DUF433 family)